MVPGFKFLRLPNTVVNFHVIKNMDWMDQILGLLSNHFEFIGLDELEEYYYGSLTQKNKCHITIDDGDLTVYTDLLPLIKKYRIPISIYVSPRSIKEGRNFWFQEIKDFDLRSLLEYHGKRYGKKVSFENKDQVYAVLKAMQIAELDELIADFKQEKGIPDKPRVGMNLEQLMELKNTGLVQVGAHTYRHPILRNETFETAKNEIVGCVEELSQMLGEKVKWFAYPNGVPGLDFGEREMNLLRDCGIRLAFSTENKRFSKADNPLSIPRTGISKGNLWFILAKMTLGSSWDTWKTAFNKNKEVDMRGRLFGGLEKT